MEQAPEVALEPGLRRRGGVEQASQVARGAGFEGLERHELADQRLGQRGVEGIEGELAGEVQQCPEGRGDRDAPVGRDVFGAQLAGAVDDEARPAPRLRPERMNRPAPRTRHRPQPGRALSRQRAGGAGEQYHCHVAAAGSDRPVAHGVNTAVKGEQGAGRDEVIDRPPLQTGS